MALLIEVAASAEILLPRRVENAFVDAGFAVRRIEREESHKNVWVAWLLRGSLELAKDNQTASKQLRRALVGRGLEILPGELTVLEQRGQQLKCAFVFGPVGLPVEI
jgi:hypothetical protein